VIFVPRERPCARVSVVRKPQRSREVRDHQNLRESLGKCRYSMRPRFPAAKSRSLRSIAAPAAACASELSAKGAIIRDAGPVLSKAAVYRSRSGQRYGSLKFTPQCGHAEIGYCDFDLDVLPKRASIVTVTNIIGRASRAPRLTVRRTLFPSASVLSKSRLRDRFTPLSAVEPWTARLAAEGRYESRSLAAKVRPEPVAESARLIRWIPVIRGDVSEEGTTGANPRMRNEMCRHRDAAAPAVALLEIVGIVPSAGRANPSR
jgi:hypothetical protein